MAGNDFWDDKARIRSPLGEVRQGFLRYCVVLSANNSLSASHKTRLENAIQEIEKNDGCVSERIEFGDAHALLSLGISADVAPQAVVDEVIITANGLDPFLRFHFFITNTHKPDEAAIAAYLAEIS